MTDFEVGMSVTCFNNKDVTDLLIIDSTYTVSGVIDDDLMMVEGVDVPVFKWRFIDPSTTGN